MAPKGEARNSTSGNTFAQTVTFQDAASLPTLASISTALVSVVPARSALGPVGSLAWRNESNSSRVSSCLYSSARGLRARGLKLLIQRPVPS